MPDDCRGKTLKLKEGNIRVRTRSDMTAVVWKDKRDMHTLTNIHDPPEDGNFCEESGNTLKPAIMKDNNQHTGCVKTVTEWRTATPSVTVCGNR
jgi:hypothetical protein